MAFDHVDALDRMTEICAERSHDISLALARLEREGMLLSQGQSRGKVYHLPGAAPVTPEQVFPTGFSSGSSGRSSGSNGASSGSSDIGSGHGDSETSVLETAATEAPAGLCQETGKAV
ncbi:MAG: hypothetical protein RJA98_3745 [Pseudomonadota bacterium]